jgi:hypothetical protein
MLYLGLAILIFFPLLRHKGRQDDNANGNPLPYLQR